MSRACRPAGRASATDGTPTATAYASSSDRLVETCVTPAGDGSRKRCTYADAWGQTRRLTPPTGPGVEYQYNPAGQLTSATCGMAVSQFGYNMTGMKTSMSDADMGSWAYTYNARGELTAQTDARSCTTSLGYDSLGR